MSGFAAICNLDSRPVDRDLLARMINAVPYRGPDGIRIWTNGSVGLGHAMLCTTPESLHETQPLVDNDAGLALTMDGRVDNRDDLVAQLTSKGCRLRDDTDAELVLRAYECWGEESPAKIIGDFAYLIWDGRRRQLFCARDTAGAKSFYYYFDGRTFFAATELQQILQNPQVPLLPNEGYIAEYLSGQLYTHDETLWSAILRLPPCHALVANANGVTRKRYFDLDPGKTIRHDTDEGYAEHFLEIFREAVRCRMRSSNGAVAADLSGGLDSSSIAVVGASELRIGNVRCARFETFTQLYSDPDADERSFSSDVAKRWHLTVNAVDPYVFNCDGYVAAVRQFRDIPPYPNVEVYLARIIVEKGFRIALTGVGGDQMMGGNGNYYADLLQNLQFGELLAELRIGREVPFLDRRRPHPLRSLLTLGILPLCPRPVRNLARRIRYGRIPRIPRTINRDFAARVDLEGRLRDASSTPRGCSPSQRSLYEEEFDNAWTTHALELVERIDGQIGLEYRHPFLDRRIIEFMFAIPAEQRNRGGVRKSILRRAMKDLLPESVRNRFTKALFNCLTADALHGLGGLGFFDFLKIADAGWVEADALKQEAGKILRSSPVVDYWPVQIAMVLEFWARESGVELPLPERVGRGLARQASARDVTETS
jgi:asparagine synthase (glutamine-hydrolysing)